MSVSPTMDRAVVAVTGADNASFLDRLLTMDVAAADRTGITYGALLTPRGTIVSDLFIHRSGDDILLDTPATVVSELCERLLAFRLRSSVEISELQDRNVIVGDNDGRPDPRHPDLPRRGFVARASALASTDPGIYHRIRIASLAPECGADYGSDSVYPADVNLDLIGGVDFAKGCFVGQEVVSRMKRRGKARRRTVLMRCAEAAPEPGTPVMAGTARLGEVTSCRQNMALARLRIDRLAETGTNEVLVGKTTANVTLPDTGA